MYTCVSVPFGSLSSVMTDDVNQRTDLSRFRSLGGTIFMTVIVIAGPVFLYKDNQPVPSHFLIMSAICAVIGLICLMFTSHWCKERIITEPVVEKKEKLNYFQVIKDITKNKALLGVMLSSFIGIVGAGMVNGLNTYLFRDYFGNVAIMAVSGMLSVLWSLIAYDSMKVVETDDTAGSAKNIHEKQLKGHAAICSKYAASMYRHTHYPAYAAFTSSIVPAFRK